MTASKKLQSTLANSGGAGEYVDDVFSTYLYTGNGSTQTITNGIDLDGEGGLVWIKDRTNVTGAQNHWFFDTDRGTGKGISSSLTNAEVSLSDWFTAFNADGFSLGSNVSVNSSSDDYASWTFRKAPGFFDVVTYTGNGTAGRTVSHNLGCDVGTVIIKRTDAAYGWVVWHKDTGVNSGYLNSTSAFANWSGHDIAATSTTFSMGNDAEVNGSGGTYVAYLFADGDDADAQIFGTDGDQAVVKCGSFTTDSSGDATIDCGFEPQFVLAKMSSDADSWLIFDNMRGVVTGGNDALLLANASNAETSTADGITFNANGFFCDGGFGRTAAAKTFIYIAIRRPHKPAESGTEVFTPRTGSDNSLISTTHLVDAFIDGVYNTSNTYNFTMCSRLTGRGGLVTSGTGAELSNWTGTKPFEYNSAYFPQIFASGAGIQYAFKRSPGFFDVVCYTGDGVAGRTVDHNLGVAPEMMIVKQRNGTTNWGVYHKDLTADYITYLEMNLQAYASTAWNNTEPTESVFSLYSTTWVNGSGNTFIAYLFASQDGISKVGSYTGNGTSQTIDCGFSSGARFVLIKRTDAANNWFVWDTTRGIVAGNDARLALNLTSAEYTGLDEIDPDSSGFIVNQTSGNNNVNAATYIYLAIA